MAKPSALTDLLVEFGAGNDEALAELVPLVEKELRRLAAGYLRKERPGHTLQPTALVNEAFLSLMKQRSVQWESRSHFFAVAALAMRQVLVQYARKHKAEKRGGGAAKIPLDENLAGAAAPEADLVALDDALKLLAAENPRQARIVELRYFGGLSVEETAEALAISPRTVKRDWMAARAWLFQQLSEREDAES